MINNLPSTPSQNSSLPVNQMSYEEAFLELEQIVDLLESGEQSLNEAMVIYQRGQELAKYCETQLGQAELKIKLISGDQLTEIPGE